MDVFAKDVGAILVIFPGEQDMCVPDDIDHGVRDGAVAQRAGVLTPIMEYLFQKLPIGAYGLRHLVLRPFIATGHIGQGQLLMHDTQVQGVYSLLSRVHWRKPCDRIGTSRRAASATGDQSDDDGGGNPSAVTQDASRQ
jgi:hypothetical protein